MTTIAPANDNACPGRKSGFLEMLRAYFRYRKQRRAMVQMLSFSDHVLADIGVTRFDIQHALVDDGSRSCGERLSRIADENRRDHERLMREALPHPGDGQLRIAA
jgi:uncharacterized protein YjiS (DUF1127 family)